MSTDSNIFMYGSLAHITLLITYVFYGKYMKKINIKNIFTIQTIITLLYFLGHLMISFAMLDRINTDNIGSLFPTISGSIGHTSLLVFSSLINRNSPFNNHHIVFVIGQIGMIYNYICEYIYKNITEPNYNYIILIIIFGLLCGFYIKKSYKAYKKSYKIVALGLFMVGCLYLTFMINKIINYYNLENDNN